jgi:hypothetical protein
MASIEEIKRAILDAAGNPDTGVVKENAGIWAEAIWKLDNKSDKEVRVIEAKETR